MNMIKMNDLQLFAEVQTTAMEGLSAEMQTTSSSVRSGPFPQMAARPLSSASFPLCPRRWSL